MRIPAAFRAEDAAAMCDVIWAALAKVGIRRDDPSTWTTARPEHLQYLKSDPVFQAIGSARTIDAIEEALEGQPWQRPRDWGAFLPAIPCRARMGCAEHGLAPPCGVMIHAMLNDLRPRCGGVNILSGSHRLVHRWFSENSPPHGTRSAQFRRSLERHPYIRDLCTAGDPGERIARFHEGVEEVDGVPLQVVENTASAGDVILMHSLLLHAAAPAAHLGTQPRFLLSKGFFERYW